MNDLVPLDKLPQPGNNDLVPANKLPQQAANDIVPADKLPKSWTDKAMKGIHAIGETVQSAVVGGAAQVAGGITGIGKLMKGGTAQEAANTVESTQEQFTKDFSPLKSTEAGRALTSKTIEPVTKFVSGFGGAAGNITHDILSQGSLNKLAPGSVDVLSSMANAGTQLATYGGIAKGVGVLGGAFKDLVPESKLPKLRPAIQKEGETVVGKVGDTHADIKPEGAGEQGEGFVDIDGQFKNRKEAAKIVKQNEPEVAKNLEKPDSLHTEDYNQASDVVPKEKIVETTEGKDESILNDQSGKVSMQLLAPGIEAGRDIKQGIQSLVLPSAKTPEHLQAAEVLGSKLGTMHRTQEQANAVLKADSRMFDKMGVFDEKIPLKDNPGIKFMSDMSVGRKQPTPQLQALADKVDSLFKGRVAKVQALDTGALQTVRDNYFPGMWEKESQAGALQYLSKRPFEGAASFTKQKVFNDIMEGIEAGLKPISNNPIDLVKLKLAELDRYIMAHEAIKEWEGKGDVTFLKLGEKMPDGYAPINDKYGKVYYKTADNQLAVAGSRIAKEPVADILNNYLSSSIYNNRYFGSAYKGYMWAANALNQFQLGVGSAFHAGFTSAETVFSGLANNMKDVYRLVRGEGSIKQVADGIKHTIAAPIINPMEGAKVLEEWLKPGSQGREVQQIAKAAELAGARTTLEKGLQTTEIDSVVRNWYGGNKVKAAVQSPIAFTELATKPIMQYLVPRQKMGVFSELAKRIIDNNPGKALEELRPQFRQAWNRVDARFGQVSYDRLFINNVAKNVIQGLVRAPGWSGGTIAELGGSVKDTMTFFKEWARTGKAPADIPDRVAYTASLIVGAAAVNGALTYAFTGQTPKGMDYWAFRTGGKDEKGRDERFVLPTYAKDLFAYYENPGKTLLAKTHPVISMIGDLTKNKDYYGVEIIRKEGSPNEKVLDAGEYVIKQFVPFWIRGAQKETERGGGVMDTLKKSPEKVLAPYVGIMPASSAYTKSKAEKEIDKVYEDTTQRPKTKEEGEQAQARRDAIDWLRAKKSPADMPDKLKKALDKMTDRQLDNIEEAASMTQLQASFKSNYITANDALRIWKVATPQERTQIEDMFWKKIDSHYDKLTTQEDKDEFERKVKEAYQGSQ